MYDRFRIVFYVTCQRCYIEALSEALNGLTLKDSREKRRPTIEKAALDRLRCELTVGIANLEATEVSYLFGIEPLEKEVPLFDAFGRWLTTALRYHGIELSEVNKILQHCSKDSRARFPVTLAEDSPASEWMRNYLAISYKEETTGRLTGDLASIRQSLEKWTDPIAETTHRKQKAWDDYRNMLMELPDQKETMFNEQFGVRKVFLVWQIRYHVAGAVGDAGSPRILSDVGKLFGALISNRTSGDDLIILCGGPGSGKSTLCRVLASQCVSTFLIPLENIWSEWTPLARDV